VEEGKPWGKVNFSPSEKGVNTRGRHGSRKHENEKKDVGAPWQM